MGEQADYELDKLFDWETGGCGMGYIPPRRTWARRPELVPADPQAFDDLTAPVLEAVAPRQMELLEWAP